MRTAGRLVNESSTLFTWTSLRNFPYLFFVVCSVRFEQLTLFASLAGMALVATHGAVGSTTFVARPDVWHHRKSWFRITTFGWLSNIHPLALGFNT